MYIFINEKRELKVDDLLELTDNNIFTFYNRERYPLTLWITIHDFKKTPSYKIYKTKLHSIIRKEKLNKLLKK